MVFKLRKNKVSKPELPTSLSNSAKLHTMNTFEQKLFGSQTDKGGNLSLLNGVGDWVAEWGDGTIGNGQSVAITPDKYMSGSIRYPGGTGANWLIWEDQYFCGADAVYGDIFKYDSWYTTHVANAISSYGQPEKLPLSNFCEYANIYVQNAQIHVVLNIYTQTNDEVIVSIEQFKTALNDNNRVINWELGNEVYSTAIGYDAFVNDAVEAGSFPNLAGADLARAKLIFPGELYNGNTWARRCATICSYIKTNYPNDKIGIPSELLRRWSEPGGGADYWVSNQNKVKQWAVDQKTHIPDANYDAVIFHPYLAMSQIMITDLAGQAIPASGKELDASFTDQDDNFWRYFATMSQYTFLNKMDDANELYPNSKQVWFTEWGILANSGEPSAQLKSGTATSTSIGKLVDSGGGFSGVVGVNDWVTSGTGSTTYVTAVDSDTQLSVNDDIFTSGNAYRIYTEDYPEGYVDQYTNDITYRGVSIATSLISLAIEYLRWKGVREVATSNIHAIVRGGGYIHQFYTSGYLKHQSSAYVLFDQVIKNSTKICVPILNDAGVQYNGVAPLDNLKFHPVTVLFSENADKSSQWAYIVNNNPNSRTISLPFSTSSGKKLEPTAIPKDPFEFLVTDTTYDDYNDFTAAVNAAATMTAVGFSVYAIKNTGTAVDLSNYIMSVS